MNKTYDKIYKRDTTGNVRVWFMEQEGPRYRTHAGVLGGNLVISHWKRAHPTNEGRANYRDSTQQAEFEIAAMYENKLSREYHRTVEDIDAGAHFFKPMLAHKYERFQEGYAQPKLDGIRCIISRRGAFSRQGKVLPGAAHILLQLQPLFEVRPDLVLDGELYNHKLKDDFNTIASLVKKANVTETEAERVWDLVQYHVYDVPSVIGDFSERYHALSVLSEQTLDLHSVHVVDTLRITDAEQYDRLHGWWIEAGYEGSMWRDGRAPYEQKRSKALLKRKEFQDEEFELVAIEEGRGNWEGFAKRAVCRLPDGRTFGAGIKGTQERARALLHEKHSIVTVKFFQYTPDGIPRFPIAVKFHGQEKI